MFRRERTALIEWVSRSRLLTVVHVSLAVDGPQRLALLLVGHDQKMPALAIGSCWRLHR